MSIRALVALVGLIAVPDIATAQHGGEAPSNTSAPAEASQFNFLIGQWELEVKPKATTLAMRIHGVPKLQGTWKAWRALDGWGVVDELRIADASGNPLSLTHFVRVFDMPARRWSISALNVYRATYTLSTAQWQENELRTSAFAIVADGKPALSRVRITNVTPNGFRYRQDRSTDGGRTWTADILVMEAKRTAATATR